MERWRNAKLKSTGAQEGLFPVLPERCLKSQGKEEKCVFLSQLCSSPLAPHLQVLPGWLTWAGRPRAEHGGETLRKFQTWDTHSFWLPLSFPSWFSNLSRVTALLGVGGSELTSLIAMHALWSSFNFLWLYLISPHSKAFVQEMSLWSRHWLAVWPWSVDSLGLGLFRNFLFMEFFLKPLVNCHLKPQYRFPCYLKVRVFLWHILWAEKESSAEATANSECYFCFLPFFFFFCKNEYPLWLSFGQWNRY